MRKMRRLLVVFTLLTLALSVNAQSEEVTQTVKKPVLNSTFWKNLMGGFEIGTGIPHKGIEPTSYAVYFGYKFIPRTYVFIMDEEQIGLMHKDGDRNFTKTNNLGGGLGYRFVNSEADGIYWDIRGSVAAAIGKSEWKQTVYDVKVVFGFIRAGMTFGLGFRHINSHTAGINCYNSIYATIGFGF